MGTRLWMAALAAGALCVGTAGCGSGGTTPSPVQTAPPASNLAGNWLLAGTLPEGPFQRETGTELSVTFSTVGNQIVGLGQFLVSCPAGVGLFGTGEGGGFAATGTVNADGSFAVQSPATTTNGIATTSVGITGTVPSAAGDSWSGSYTINTNGDGGCSVQQSASLTAQAIEPFTGTYVATGTYADGTAAAPVPVTVTMLLQQGARSTLPTGDVVDTAYVLSGTLTVEGVPCFHTGSSVTSATPQPNGVGGAVFGAMGFPTFKMDDGSLVVVNVYSNDLLASQLDANALGVAGGNCASTSGRQVRLGNFTRQN